MEPDTEDWTLSLKGLFSNEAVQFCTHIRRLLHSRDAGERREGCIFLASKIAFPFLTVKGLGRDIARLVNDVNDEVRVAACNLLVEMGDYGAPALPELLTCLEADEKEVRQEAIRAVSVVAKSENEASKERAANELERMLLRQAEPATQAAAAQGLAELAPASAPQALEDLLERSTQPDPRKAAALALGALKERREALAKLAERPEFEDRSAGLDALLLLGAEAGEHAPIVAQRLAEPLLRCRALAALGAMERSAEPYLMKVAGYLNDPDSDVRLAAVEALEKLRPFAGQEVVEAAAELLHHHDPRLRATGISALGVLGEEKAGKYAEAISKFIVDDDVKRRGVNTNVPIWMRQADCAAVHTLAKFGATGQRFAYRVNGLCLAASSVEARLVAMEAFGSMGTAAAEHARALEDCLIEEDLAVVVTALVQLARLYVSGVSVNIAKGMVEAVNKMEEGDRAQGILALGAPSAPEPVLQALAKWLKLEGKSSKTEEGENAKEDAKEDPNLPEDPEVIAAIVALGHVGEPACCHAKALVDLLSAKHEGVRRAAVEALGAMKAMKVAENVAEKLQDTFEVRKAAATSLGQLAEAGAEYQQDVATLLSSPLGLLRQTACEALGKLGEEGQALGSEVLALLQEVAGDEIPCVRKAAVRTLEGAM